MSSVYRCRYSFWKFAWIGLSVLAISLGSAASLNAQSNEQDEKEAQSLDNQATTASGASDNKFACETWEQLFKQYPKYSDINGARYRCGVAYNALKNYKRAIQLFDEAIDTGADAKAFPQLEATYLYKGYSQYSLGQSSKGGEEQKGHLKDSIATFNAMLEKFKTGKYADQALMFLGDSHFNLNQHAKAAESYQQVVDNYPKSSFFLNAHSALGSALSRMQKNAEAEKFYAKFVELAKANNAKAETDSSVAKVERSRILTAEMNVADAQLGQAMFAMEKKDNETAKTLLSKTLKSYEALAEADGFVDRDRCMYQLGYCYQQLGQFDKAATAFETLANQFPDSSLNNKSTMEAGRASYFARKFDTAFDWFSKLKSERRFAGEATHFMMLIHFQKKQHKEAAELAQSVLAEINENDPFLVQLKMDYADSLYHQPKSKKISVKEYLKIAESHAKHALAPQALYYAAFASYESGQPKQAIGLCNQFEEQFAENSFAADVQQVKADSLIQTEDYSLSEKVFDGIINDNPDHVNVGMWLVRRAVSQYFQRKYNDAISDLNENLDKLKTKRDIALANYWLAASYFDTKKWEEAQTAAKKSIDTEANNPRAGEAALLIARSRFQLDDAEGAIKTASAALEMTDDPGIAERLHFRLGEFYESLNQFDKAATEFAAVIKSGRNKNLLPNSFYSLAWAQLKQKNYDDAIESFTEVIDQFSDNPLKDDAVLGRGMAYRQKGSHAKAIKDLKIYVSGNGSASDKTNARFEIGLSQVASKEWSDAITTFNELLDADPKSKIADRVRYELAWAYRDNKNAEKSIDQFDKLATSFPNSPFAAEAYFHVAQAEYDGKNYDDAIDNYKNCIDKTKNDSHAEKAHYKLAWCHFQKRDYTKAEQGFRAQTNKFPKGVLNADGLFMVSECLFRQKKYKDAVSAYKVAAPEVAKADVDANVKLRTLLHGAQSANKAALYDDALQFAKQIIRRNEEDAYTTGAWLEVGLAHKGKKEFDEAIDAFTKSSKPVNETGAQSYCMLGEVYFEQKKFDKAISEFKKVIYGYGGTRSADNIKPWQSMAAYEAARCNQVQIQATSDDAKRKEFIEEAKKMYKYVVDNHAKDRLAPEARKQLQRLSRM